MLFSSIFFLWVFLPIVLILYFIAPGIRIKNAVLLIASLIFYSWGEPYYILLMLLVVTVDFFAALIIDKIRSKYVIAAAIAVNLLVLGIFKYYDFGAGIVNRLFSGEILAIRNIALPLGISFYTFQSMSYIIDVYRKETKPQRNFFKLLLYVSLFPQLVAGPIVRYKDVANDIDSRKITGENIAYGAKRFCMGLGKKVLISNIIAQYADYIMDGDIAQFSSGALWVGAILYTLQIYYDFSGYSDMAIGLGRIFGFKFLENFNYPYISSSIQEFWRRWHISLSSWFKEYLYIPLGGNRKGKFRTYINLLIVFFLTGLWHGASYSFIFWGLFHGAFLVLERLFLGKLLKKNPLKIINHIYVLCTVIIGWVFFRIDSLRAGLSYVLKMISFKSGEYGATDVISPRMLLVTVIGILLMGFFQEGIKPFKQRIFNEREVSIFETVFMAVCFLSCAMMLVSNTYNPFIYFRF